MSFTTYERLSAFFDQAAERELKKGGASLTYIPVSEVIDRMNTVVGLENWSMQVIRVGRDELDPDFIVAHVRVEAILDGRTIHRDGLGGQKIKRTSSKSEIVDLGDEYKGAVSDAFKKACQTMGVALYLARSEEAMEAALNEATPVAPVPAAPTDPEAAEAFNTLKSHLDKMTADEKTTLKTWWSEQFPDSRPPSSASPVDQLRGAIVKCVEMAFELKS